jgi:putative ABC transport system ATP-binding protein
VAVYDVTKVYALGRTRVQALNGVTLAVSEGEFMAVAGPSGSGKSTLLNLIGGLDRPTSGRVVIGGQDVSQLGDDLLSDLRAHTIGFIFQTFNLIPVLSAAENVEFPLLVRRNAGIARRGEGGASPWLRAADLFRREHWKKQSAQPKPRREDTRERARRALEQVGLEGFLRHRPDELSGGQRQRVAVARALVTEPSLVLADEPTANLDSATGEAIIDLMLEINRRQLTTFIFSTHDPRVMAHAHRVVQLQDGRLAPGSSIITAVEQRP